MNGGDARRLEFGEVEAELVLHSGKSGCGQAVASDVFRVDGRKL